MKMNNPNPPKKNNKKSLGRSGKLAVVAGAILVLVVISVLLRPSGKKDEVTFVAQRGSMDIKVIEGGSIEATQAQVIKSKVQNQGGTTILRIVEEGYQVTEEDVLKGLVLVELDSAPIEEKIRSQELDAQGALANLMEYIKVKEIRESANLSSIKAASLEAKFALMDFKKYLGAEAAEKIIADIGLSEESIESIGQGEMGDSKQNLQKNLDMFTSKVKSPTVSTNTPPQDPALLEVNSDNPPLAGAVNETSQSANQSAQALSPSPGEIDPLDFMNLDSEAEKQLLPKIKEYDLDFAIFTSDENEEMLGDGEARQELRKLKDALLIAESEYALRKKTYEGSIRLADNGFLTDNELQDKKIGFEKTANSLESAKANLQLFRTYDIQKQAEKLLLNYEQALMKLSRARKDALAELADSVGDLNRARRQYDWESKHLGWLREQFEACTIVAERPGLVVYGDGSGSWDPDEIIREGAKVRERQAIITIPDMRYMALEVKIHESKVKRVKKGMPVKIVADAEPDRTLEGVVEQVSVLPDSENQRFNPDQKVYKTRIAIKGMHEWVKPGMAARAEILIRDIEDTIIVPVQAVRSIGDDQVVIVRSNDKPQVRRVEVEDFNNRFAAISSGLSESEVVYLQVPEGFDLKADYIIEGSPALSAVED